MLFTILINNACSEKSSFNEEDSEDNRPSNVTFSIEHNNKIKDAIFQIASVVLGATTFMAIQKNYDSIQNFFKNLFNRKPPLKNIEPIIGYKDIRKNLNFIVKNFFDEFKNKRFKDTHSEGIILSGPPGTGKTTLAIQLANKFGIKYFILESNKIKTKWYGETESNLINFLNNALANKPSIIIIDEFNLIFHKDGSEVDSNIQQNLNQILISFMDGVKDTSGVFIIGTTNDLESIPKPLLREGRFSHVIKVDLPSFDDRKEILSYYFNQYKISIHDKSVIDYAARKTDGYNNADLKGLCKYIAQKHIILLTQENFNQLYLEKKSQKIIVHNKETMDLSTFDDIALHESGHAILSFIFTLKENMKYHFDFVTINGIDDSLGSSHSLSIQTTKSFTKQELSNHIKISFAGRVAQELFGSQNLDTGAYSDLYQAYNLAKDMVLLYGMGKKKSIFIVSNDSIINQKEIKDEIEALLEEEYNKTKNLLIEYKNFLLMVAKELKEKKILYFEDIKNIYNLYEKNKVKNFDNTTHQKNKKIQKRKKIRHKKTSIKEVIQ